MSDDLSEAVAYRVATGRPLKLARRDDGTWILEPYASDEEYEEAVRMATGLRARLDAAFTAQPVAPAIQPERPDSQMSDERLAEIDADHAIRCPIMHYEDGIASQRQLERANRVDAVNEDHCDIVELLAEVRRLRRALALSEASRGTPSVVGGD